VFAQLFHIKVCLCLGGQQLLVLALQRSQLILVDFHCRLLGHVLEIDLFQLVLLGHGVLLFLLQNLDLFAQFGRFLGFLLVLFHRCLSLFHQKKKKKKKNGQN